MKNKFLTCLFVIPCILVLCSSSSLAYGEILCCKTFYGGSGERKVCRVVDGYICPIGWYEE
jgi:hypothetical protein